MSTGYYVYRYIHNETVVYVGRTISMQQRVKQHKTDSQSDKFLSYCKDHHMAYEDFKIDYISLKSAAEERIVELFLINLYKPELNDAEKYDGGIELISFNSFDSFVEYKAEDEEKKKCKKKDTPEVDVCRFNLPEENPLLKDYAQTIAEYYTPIEVKSSVGARKYADLQDRWFVLSQLYKFVSNGGSDVLILNGIHDFCHIFLGNKRTKFHTHIIRYIEYDPELDQSEIHLLYGEKTKRLLFIIRLHVNALQLALENSNVQSKFLKYINPLYDCNEELKISEMETNQVLTEEELREFCGEGDT